MPKRRTLRELPLLKLASGSSPRVQRVLFAVGLFALTYLVMVIFGMEARLDVSVGRPSPRTVYAPRDVIDEFTTNQLREAAAAEVPDVYEYDPYPLQRALREIGFYFDAFQEIIENDHLDDERKEEAFRSLLPGDLPRSAPAALVTDIVTLRDLQGRLIGTISEVFEQGIKEGQEDAARRRLFQEIALYPFSADLKRVAEALVEPLIRKNMHYDAEKTELNRELARRQVEPLVILRNTLIVSEGEPVSEQQLAQLQEMGLVRGQHADYPGYIGLFLILFVLFVVAGVYIHIFVNHVYNRLSLLLLMGLVFLITLLFSVGATYFSGYLIPVAMGSILITVLFGYKLALIVTLALGLMVGLFSGGEFSYILVAITGGLVSIYAVTRLSQRSDLARAGFYAALTNGFLIIALHLFFGNIGLERDMLTAFGYSVLAGLGSGIFSAVGAIGMLPYLENLFGVTTSITLLELSSPNHPLLRELLMKAPGSYYHSMMVSNLAEAAAEKVNAEALLARVGSYYHDIGKLKRPYFFSENQLTEENPHSKLSPNLSALIIGAHPKDGVELGKEHNLPEAIVDIAAQHHGTSMISFFYQQALGNCGQSKVDPDNFRYEGPKPQSKEAAIVMLADAVEAGVRSMAKPSGNRVEMMVRRLIKEKLEDGQLDQSNLTLKEIDQICGAFVYILSGIYHTRIEYPEKELKAELEKSVANR